MDLKKINEILKKNKKKNFVQRIIDSEKYPSLDNGDGSHSTHSMAYAGVDDGYIVYPTVVANDETEAMLTMQPLKRLGGSDAIAHAWDNGEFVKFKNEKDAAEFARQYKKVWNKK